MSFLVVDISELAGGPGASRRIMRAERLPGLQGGMGWVDEGHPVGLNLLAESLTDGIAVSGRVSGIMHLSCSRCLMEYSAAFDEWIREVFYFERAEEREGYEVRGTEIDLEPMLRDAIVLAIPVRPLHREACRGLCPVCGADRNVVDCGHSTAAMDPRWAPLLLTTNREA